MKRADSGDRHRLKRPIRLVESHGAGLLKKRIAFEVGAKRRTNPPRFSQVLLSLILPHGYPDSVTPDYLPFQFWDTVQGLCTYLRQQSLLAGLGVGDASATLVSAALSWTFLCTDQCGRSDSLLNFTLAGASMLGGIVFAFKISVEFGADPKRWRLFADIMNDVGLALTLFAPLAGPFFLAFAGLGSVCSAICGVAAGATKAAITQHFVKQKSNAALISDLYAKEGTQETIVSLSGLVLGSAMAFFIGESLFLRWMVFFLLTALHIWANYCAVTSLCFNSLNDQRTTILIYHFRRTNSVLNPMEVSRCERVWKRPRLPAVRLGVPLHSLIFDNQTYRRFRSAIASGWYVLFETHGKIDVLLREGADSSVILQAYFEASLASKLGINAARPEFESAFPLFLAGLNEKLWAADQVLISDQSWRYVFK